MQWLSRYVTAGAKSRNDDGGIVWQCFVSKILRDHSLSGCKNFG
jgi:hypothetical protein